MYELRMYSGREYLASYLKSFFTHACILYDEIKNIITVQYMPFFITRKK